MDINSLSRFFVKYSLSNLLGPCQKVTLFPFSRGHPLKNRFLVLLALVNALQIEHSIVYIDCVHVIV